MKRLTRILTTAVFVAAFVWILPFAMADKTKEKLHKPKKPALVLEEGKQYLTLKHASNALPLTPGKIQVVEFFSYGCHWCAQLETALGPWKDHLQKDMTFVRVPVEFNRDNWTILAKAYYTARILNVENTLTPLFFRAIHSESANLDTNTAIENFFVQHGVTQKDFASVYHFSPGIEGELLRGRHLVRDYEIFQIPTIIINGKYKTDVQMAGGPQVILDVVDALVEKERNIHHD